ncbi:hypothetical protein BH09BAC3_BH09BAC3_37300 [soil metagenome]
MDNKENNTAEIDDLKFRLEEAEQLIEAIKTGEVDAFAIRKEDKSEIFTLQSADYAYRLLVENFREGAINITEDGLIVYCNKYFYNLLELSYEKMVGKKIYDFIHPESKPIFNALLQKALGGQSKGEMNLLSAKKSIPVYVSFTSLYPHIAAIGIIITDLTEKKENERLLTAKNQELETANTELASFSYIASHDLKEPLRKIQSFSKRILDTETFSDKTHDYFNRIISAASRMENLIASLFEFSQASAAEMNFQPYDLNKIVEEAKLLIKETILEKQATIELEKLPVVDVVPVLLLQLVTNLLDNALKYSRADVKPIIKISYALVAGNNISHALAHKHKSYHQINITDNGIGFEKQYANKIFELFQRLHNKNEYTGTGLGLAICKKIVTSHNGFLIADGMPNEGSTFSIYIPSRHE